MRQTTSLFNNPTELFCFVGKYEILRENRCFISKTKIFPNLVFFSGGHTGETGDFPPAGGSLYFSENTPSGGKLCPTGRFIFSMFPGGKSPWVGKAAYFVDQTLPPGGLVHKTKCTHSKHTAVVPVPRYLQLSLNPRWTRSASIDGRYLNKCNLKQTLS